MPGAAEDETIRKELTVLYPDETTVWTIFLCVWLALCGAALASFLDCCISRLSAGDAHPFGGRSRCLSCGHTLGAADLAPVFSWLFLRGRCRYCGKRIPAECVLSELAGAAAFAGLALRFGPVPELGQWLILAGVLLALSLTDLAKRIIPDRLLLLLAANRAVWFLVLGQGTAEALTALKACAVPAALLVLVLLLEKMIAREAMGGGDIKLLFALALYLSWAQLVLTLLAGCLLGLVWAALTGGKKGSVLPFGPFLAAGAVLTICCGEPLLLWYFGLF